MLAPWVSYCRIGDMAVFLDVRRDRYRAMAWDSAQALIGGASTPMSGRIVNRAHALGWLDDASTGIIQTPPQLSPAEELSPDGMDYWPSGWAIAQSLGLLVKTRLRLSVQPLEGILAQVSDRNRAIGSADGPGWPAMAPTLAAFRMAERYALASNTCLLRSLALHAALAGRGVASSVVFGVKLHPFEAHCWVQQGATLLNDTVERTGLFVPIRVVN